MLQGVEPLLHCVPSIVVVVVVLLAQWING